MAGKDISPKASSPEVENNPDAEALGPEIGVEYNLPFSVPYSDGLSRKDREAQELREILRESGEDSGPTVAQLVAMRRLDGQARALYRLLTLPIRAALAHSTFVPAEGGEAEAEFITQVFTLPPSQGGMSVTFHRFMSQLLQGLFDGFAPFEQVYWKPSFGPLAGKYTLKKLAYRQSDTISIIEDDKGHFQGFRQRAIHGGKTVDVHIPKDRAFYFAAQEEERKYYGVSFFQSAFYHYDKKIKMYYIAHIAAQRAAVGTRIGTYPQNATQNQKQALASSLSNLALAQWMLVPEGTKVDMLRESGSFQFLDFINHHNNQMSKSILANFFDKDTGGGSGDARLVSFGQPGDDMFVLMLRAIMDDIANSINHYIIPRLIDWNFSGGKYPTFQWAELTDDQKAVISSTFDKLSTAGQSVTVTPEFVREIEKKMAREMGLEIDWDAVESREQQEREALNIQQGLNPDGTPMAQEVTGQDALAAWEAQVAGVVPPTAEEVPNSDARNRNQVTLSSDPDADLLGLAADLMERAQLELSERRVRTPAGEKLYGQPIGSVIGEDRPGDDETAGKAVTIERLHNLKMQFEEFIRAGNHAEAQKVQQKLRDAVADYTGDDSIPTFLKMMKRLDVKQGGQGGVPPVSTSTA